MRKLTAAEWVEMCEIGTAWISGQISTSEYLRRYRVITEKRKELCTR